MSAAIGFLKGIFWKSPTGNIQVSHGKLYRGDYRQVYTLPNLELKPFTPVYELNLYAKGCTWDLHYLSNQPFVIFSRFIITVFYSNRKLLLKFINLPPPLKLHTLL